VRGRLQAQPRRQSVNLVFQKGHPRTSMLTVLIYSCSFPRNSRAHSSWFRGFTSFSTEGRKAILFCTHAIWKGITFKVLEKELLSEVYSTLYLFRKMKQDKPADSSDSINKIKQTLQKRTVACPNKIKLLSRCNLYKK
jgi:hypothetical protein